MKLFDLDGTLIDSNRVWQEVDDRFLTAHGLEATEEYLFQVGHSIFPIAAQYTREYYHLTLTPQEIMDEWLALAQDAYEHHIPLKPGAREYLTQEASRGETLALVSACVPSLGHAVMERHGLTALFHHIVFAQELGLEKRDPCFWGRVLSLLDVSSAECTLYDDAPINCLGAKEEGMTVVGVLDPLYERDKARMYRICHRCISDFTELLDP